MSACGNIHVGTHPDEGIAVLPPFDRYNIEYQDITAPITLYLCFQTIGFEQGFEMQCSPFKLGASLGYIACILTVCVIGNHLHELKDITSRDEGIRSRDHL